VESRKRAGADERFSGASQFRQELLADVGLRDALGDFSGHIEVHLGVVVTAEAVSGGKAHVSVGGAEIRDVIMGQAEIQAPAGVVNGGFLPGHPYVNAAEEVLGDGLVLRGTGSPMVPRGVGQLQEFILLLLREIPLPRKLPGFLEQILRQTPLRLGVRQRFSGFF
jgi:hypothetical protein